MTDGKHIYRVSYHGGSLCALVEAETPERAVEIAKAHREKKFGFGRKPPKAVREDRYEPALASEHDIAWARSFGVGVITDMPSESRRGRPRSRKRPADTPEGAEAVARAGG